MIVITTELLYRLLIIIINTIKSINPINFLIILEAKLMHPFLYF